ncbi:MAG: DUF3084 domain-containing protein [Quinella sp. 2Q5]|nr:DUF3084 domain-containing protein [Quinella sp. 2Q5]
MEGIYLIFVMIVTGGAIAFIGDKLGTKIGKKRLSIFGLRPRHTSMIVTVVTGGLITALSIGFMVLISQNVRTALFGMDELRATMNSTLEELDEATENLFKAQTEFERANENLRESKTEIASLKTEQEELRAESDRLKEEGSRLQSTNDELTALNENLSGNNAALTADNQKLTDFNVTLTADNDKLSSANDKLSSDNTELEQRNQRLREGIIAIREGDITLRAGEILASGIIRGGRTAEEISADIKALADRATQNIVSRFGGDENTAVWIYQPELHRTIEQIESSGNDMVLRISAAGNLVRGEPVRARLEVYPNQKIFGRGEQIFAKTYTLDDANPPELVLQDFLTEINRLSVERGILSDPLTGSVGRMEGSQLYEVLDTLDDIKGSVRLTAYAREETDSQGPLRLNIRVQGA